MFNTLLKKFIDLGPEISTINVSKLIEAAALIVRIDGDVKNGINFYKRYPLTKEEHIYGISIEVDFYPLGYAIKKQCTNNVIEKMFDYIEEFITDKSILTEILVDAIKAAILYRNKEVLTNLLQKDTACINLAIKGMKFKCMERVFGYSPLNLAISIGNLDAVKQLLLFDVNIHLVEIAKTTCIQLAQNYIEFGKKMPEQASLIEKRIEIFNALRASDHLAKGMLACKAKNKDELMRHVAKACSLNPSFIIEYIEFNIQNQTLMYKPLNEDVHQFLLQLILLSNYIFQNSPHYKNFHEVVLTLIGLSCAQGKLFVSEEERNEFLTSPLMPSLLKDSIILSTLESMEEGSKLASSLKPGFFKQKRLPIQHERITSSKLHAHIRTSSI